MAVEISGVTHGPNDDLITGAWLDSPHTGPVDGYGFEAVGWVVGKEPVAEVEFVHEGRAVARCELTVSRPRAAELYGSSSSQVGFSKAIETFGLAPDFAIKVRVVFQDGRRRQIAEIRGTQQLTSAFTGAGGTGAAATTTGKAGSAGATGGTGKARSAGAPGTGGTAAAGTGAGGARGAGGEATGGTAGAGSTAGAGGTDDTGGARWRRRRR
jgi:hypothetical protein